MCVFRLLGTNSPVCGAHIPHLHLEPFDTLPTGEAWAHHDIQARTYLHRRSAEAEADGRHRTSVLSQADFR